MTHTQYSYLTNEELISLADQQEFNVSEIGCELMQRLSDAVDTIKNLENELDEIDSNSLIDRVNDLEDEVDTLQNENNDLKNELEDR